MISHHSADILPGVQARAPGFFSESFFQVGGKVKRLSQHHSTIEDGHFYCSRRQYHGMVMTYSVDLVTVTPHPFAAARGRATYADLSTKLLTLCDKAWA